MRPKTVWTRQEAVELKPFTPTLTRFEDWSKEVLAAFVLMGREFGCVSIQRELGAIWSDFTDGNPQTTPLAFPQGDLADDALRRRQVWIVYLQDQRSGVSRPGFALPGAVVD